MRKVSSLQIVCLLFCLCLTGLLMLLLPQTQITHQGRSLDQSLASLDGWKPVGTNRLSPVVIDALQLDDYLFQSYQKGLSQVTLYVGYYFSGKKVGAAHDPQVCYPVQGWKLTDKQLGQYTINDNQLEYSSIVATLNGEKDLIYYWFQIDDRTASNTFQQKLLLFRNKLLGRGEVNAFVRISVTLNDSSKENAERVLKNFIEAFYPMFLNHVLKKS